MPTSIGPGDEHLTKRLSPSQLSLLLRVSSALASSLDLRVVLQTSIESAVEVLGLDTGAIYLLDSEALYLGATTPPLDPGTPEELRHAVIGEHPHLQKAVDTGTPVYLHDAGDADLSPAEKIVVASRGLRSILYAPLMLEGRAIGTFIVGTTTSTHMFTEEEIDLCMVLSSQIALAVTNARLHESVMRANAEIMRINANLETLVEERTEELALMNLELQNHAEELKSQAEELEERTEDLADSNEARARFLRALGHEFRTPLNVIVGAADHMLHGLAGELDKEALSQVERINKVSHHLLTLSDDVLDLSRIDAGVLHLTIGPVEVASMMEECLGALSDQAALKGLEMKCSFSEVVPTLQSDKVRIRQIMLNLLTNAVKYTEAGTITVTFEQSDESHVVLRVADTGPGIAEDRREAVFTEFSHDYQADSGTEGLGLGLAISRRLASALGGSLTLESEVGKGSTFSLTLPLRFEL